MAGRYFSKLTGKVLPRITGLDPSRHCFGESDRSNGLQRGDALLVDIIYSTRLWGLDPVGDAHFYPGLERLAITTISKTSNYALQT